MISVKPLLNSTIVVILVVSMAGCSEPPKKEFASVYVEKTLNPETDRQRESAELIKSCIVGVISELGWSDEDVQVLTEVSETGSGDNVPEEKLLSSVIKMKKMEVILDKCIELSDGNAK